MNRAFSIADLHEAQRMRADGCTYRTISEALGFSLSTVQYQLDGTIREKVRAYNKKRYVPKPKRARGSVEQLAHKSICNSKRHAKKFDYTPILTPEHEVAAAYTGVCYMCGVPQAECNHKLVADHNHDTGEFRGWACRKCNTMIGYVENNRSLVEKIFARTPSLQP